MKTGTLVIARTIGPHGLHQALVGKRVYLDANILIYLLEGNDDFRNVLKALMEQISNRDIQAVSSTFVYTEVLPKPVQKQDKATLKYILSFMSRGLVDLVPVTQTTTIQAGILRGELRMKAPDAIHVATAIETKCDIVLSNDKGIKLPADSGIELLCLQRGMTS